MQCNSTKVDELVVGNITAKALVAFAQAIITGIYACIHIFQSWKHVCTHISSLLRSSSDPLSHVWCIYVCLYVYIYIYLYKKVVWRGPLQSSQVRNASLEAEKGMFQTGQSTAKMCFADLEEASINSSMHEYRPQCSHCLWFHRCVVLFVFSMHLYIQILSTAMEHAQRFWKCRESPFLVASLSQVSRPKYW